MRLFKILSFKLLIFYLISCSAPPAPDIPANPYDTNHPDFVWPKTTITQGPEFGEILSQPQVTFSWSGSESVKDYSYRFDTEEWSDWVTTTSLTFYYLDEKEYSFAVRSRHKNEQTIEEEYPEITFMVDAVQGPAVMFFPRRKEVAGISTISYDILAEEVVGLLGAKIGLTYDNSRIRITSVGKGTHLSSNGGDGVLFYDIDNAEGSTVIELAITGGATKGISGSGMIARIHFEVLSSGIATIGIDADLTEYRDIDNNSIEINEFVGGRVEVQ